MQLSTVPKGADKATNFSWLQGVFNSKQGAAGKGGDETIWLEKDVLGPLAGTNTAFLFQVIYHELYKYTCKCEKVKFSTYN